MKELKKSLLSGVTIASEKESAEYFEDNDFRWAETLTGEDSPTGKPYILINDKKFKSAGAKNYRDKMILGESLHLLKTKQPDVYRILARAAERDPLYKRWAQESYAHSKREYGENRPFDQWHEQSRFDQVIGGYLFANDPDIPTMKNWHRDKLPIGSEFRGLLELLGQHLEIE